MRVCLFVVTLVAASAATATTQPLNTPSPSGGPRADAYYQFLLGRHLEQSDDVEGAIAAYRKAADLDPGSSVARAELAALYARHDRAKEAMAAAEAALRVNPRDVEAHRVLGAVLAALADAPKASSTDAAPTSDDYVRQAVTHLEQALAGQPSDVSTRLTLARLYLRTRAFDKAIASLTRVLEEEPGLPDAVLLLARAYAGSGRRADAIRALEEATAGPSRFFRGLIVLGELYESDRRWRDAADAYGRAAAQNPRSADLKIRRATALMNAGDQPAARDYLREVAAAHPADGSALYLLSQAERDTGDLAAAEAAARRLTAMDPADVRGPYALARVLELRRDYRGIVATLEPVVASLRTQPGSGRQRVLLLASLGFAYQELGDHDRAIAIFDEARGLSPADVNLDAYLAQAQIRGRRHADALKVLREARARAPQDFRLARLEAQALEQSGRLDDGVRVLRDAMDRFPDDPAVPFELGAIYERREQFDQAERAFRQALTRDARHAPTLNYLGYMLAVRGQRLDESVTLIRRALDVEPDNAAYLDSLGWAYFKLNRLADAETYLQRAADQLVTNSVVQDHFGDLLFKRGRYAEAILAWERALAGDGDSIERRALEKKIRVARARLR